MELRDVSAAGAVVTRPGGQVLLVHRPKYDDWSFPKGKLDPGEHSVTAAVREVAEETGLDVRLGPALSSQRYRMSNGRYKSVDYWTARVVGSDDVSTYAVNDEIDAVEWVDGPAAMRRLTYPYDRDTLAESLPLRRKTHALVVLRHGHARNRGEWKKDDRQRPLDRLGEEQAGRVVPLLAAFGVASAHTSPSVRCVQTLAPFVDTTGIQPEVHDELSEEGASEKAIARLVGGLLDSGRRVVVCTHRPVLPWVMAALGLPETRFDPGSMLVVHHRTGRVVATQLLDPSAGA